MSACASPAAAEVPLVVVSSSKAVTSPVIASRVKVLVSEELKSFPLVAKTSTLETSESADTFNAALLTPDTVTVPPISAPFKIEMVAAPPFSTRLVLSDSSS